MERYLLDWLVRYGPPVVFFAQLFGIFGLPIPDELLLTVAGALVRRGELPSVPTALAAVTGCMTGITLSYVLGRTVGVRAMRRLFLRHEAALIRVQNGFQRFGCWLLAIGYYVPGVRHVTAITAGSIPLRYRTFALYAYPGAVVWCATFLGLGYVAGDRWREAFEAVRHHVALTALVAAAALVAYALWTRPRGIAGTGR